MNPRLKTRTTCLSWWSSGRLRRRPRKSSRVKSGCWGIQLDSGHMLASTSSFASRVATLPYPAGLVDNATSLVSSLYDLQPDFSVAVSPE